MYSEERSIIKSARWGKWPSDGRPKFIPYPAFTEIRHVAWKHSALSASSGRGLKFSACQVRYVKGLG